MHLEFTALRGSHFALEPVEERHRDALRVVLDCDEDGWNILPRRGSGDGFPDFWKATTSSPARHAYVVRDRESEELVGTSSFIDVDAKNATLEIGGTWFKPELRGSEANPETKLLMLSHAFASGAARVQFKVDTRNARSLAALARLGAVREGVLRKHLVTWTGYRRDSVILSILSAEWPAVREELVRRAGNVRRVGNERQT